MDVATSNSNSSNYTDEQPTMVTVLPIRQIYNINSGVCLSLGGLLNLVVIWLVLTKTPKEMRVYSKIVLQTCFCDLALLITGELVQPILIVSNGVCMILENGLSTHFPHPWHIWLYNCWFFCCYFVSVGIVIQFIYRYLTLCQNVEIRTGAYFTMLAAAALCEAVLMGFFFWIGHPPDGAHIVDEQVLRILVEPKTEEGQAVPWHMRPTLHGDKADIRWIAWIVAFLMFSSSCYAIIWFCGINMVRYVRNNLKMGSNCSKRVAEVNRQMLMNMLIQASIPMLDILVFIVAAYASMTDSKGDWFVCLQMLLGPLVGWIPVLNPLVTIITVSPYRRTLIRVGPSLPSGSTAGVVSRIFKRNSYVSSEHDAQQRNSEQQRQQQLEQQQNQNRRISTITQY